jgi:hypothetical protein
MDKDKYLEAKHNIEEECKADDNGLWFIVGQVENVFPDVEEAELKSITLSILKELMDERKIVPAVFRSESGTPEALRNDYRSWKLNPEETVKYIDEEWTKLGVRPNLGDIITFTSSDVVKGEKENEEKNKKLYKDLRNILNEVDPYDLAPPPDEYDGLIPALYTLRHIQDKKMLTDQLQKVLGSDASYSNCERIAEKLIENSQINKQ